MATRTETDSMGEVQIPEEFYYGASTQRAVDNFPISRRRFEREFVEALGLLKKAAALANSSLKRLDDKLAKTIAEAASEVAEGLHDKHFARVEDLIDLVG